MTGLAPVTKDLFLVTGMGGYGMGISKPPKTTIKSRALPPCHLYGAPEERRTALRPPAVQPLPPSAASPPEVPGPHRTIQKKVKTQISSSQFIIPLNNNMIP